MGSMRQEDQGDAPERGDPVEAGASRTSRLLKGSLLAFCCWHAVFLVISIIPGPPDRDDPGYPAVDLYRLALGGRQQWSVFDTIPALHSLDVWLEGEDEAGGEITAGCVLPGFRAYPIPERSRYYVLFYRMMYFTSYAAYRDAYLRNVAQLLAARRERGADAKWSLVTAAEYTRNLFYVRRDGKMSMLVPKTYDLATPGGSPP